MRGWECAKVGKGLCHHQFFQYAFSLTQVMKVVRLWFGDFVQNIFSVDGYYVLVATVLTVSAPTKAFRSCPRAPLLTIVDSWQGFASGGRVSALTLSTNILLRPWVLCIYVLCQILALRMMYDWCI